MDPNRCIEKENCMFDQGRSNSKSMGGEAQLIQRLRRILKNIALDLINNQN